MKYKISFALLAGIISFSYCNTSKKATATKSTISYAKHIQPIIEVQCSPCHFPAKEGKKSPLDSYENVSMQIVDIIRRIDLQPGDKGYMPMKKPRLSDSTIQLFKTWKAEGLGK